jgi:hypothetical protein
MGKCITDLSSVTTVGLDLAKLVFQVHGVDASGRVVVAKAIRRNKLLEFFASLPPPFPAICSIAMRFKIEFIWLAPRHGEPIVVETITIETATVREAEARAHAHFEAISVPAMADGFRIIEYNRMGEVLRWICGDVQSP